MTVKRTTPAALKGLATKGITGMSTRPNIVLVHGAWADGSSWSAVIERLQADGYTVTAPQFPESSLADDVARLRQVLNRQDGPTVVAAHSYGGQIMTALGTDAPNVVGLVYIAAFGLDEGESIGELLAQGGPSDPRAGPS
jgi:pimeloyl-ACP methyl ester carboxylesterase